MRILFTWEVNERLKEYLFWHPLKSDEMEFIFLKKEELEELAIPKPKNIQVLVGWGGGNPLFYKTCKKLKNLQLIINPAVGIENVVPVVKKLNKSRNIILCNSHGHTYFTAQHAVGFLLAQSNQLLLHHNATRLGKWRTGDKEGASLPLKYRKTGLLGYGPINQHVHGFLEGFNTEIHILKNTLNKKQKTNPHFYTQKQLPAFLETIDNLIIAVPLTKKTKGMIGEKELTILGENGILINVARGAIVKEKALFKALKKKKILAAASDVWYDYRPKVDKKGRKYPYHYPFHKLDNMLLSPHRGGSPLDDLDRWDETMEMLAQFEQVKPLMNIVDLDRAY